MTNTETRRVTYAEVMDAMAVDLPEGVSGEVSVRRFTVSEEDSSRTRLYAMMGGRGRGIVEAGEYTALYRRGGLWMSDTRDERRDHADFVLECYRRQAERVAISGLGLGMVAKALTIVPSVQHVDIVDIDPDVIALVEPTLRALFEAAGKTLMVRCDNAMDPASVFPKGVRWDAAWHDCWQDICADDYEEHKLIRRRYGRRVKFQDVWCAELVRYAATGRYA